MRGEGRPTTLADVRVGSSAVLLPGTALDARRSQRLVELGLRPGATVRVMMRTAGGGRVLGVDNLRIVVDRFILRSIPVALPRTGAANGSACLPSDRVGTDHPRTDHPHTDHPHPRPQGDRGGERVARRRRSGGRLGATGRRLRLLGRAPGLTALPGEPVGDGTD